MQPIYSSTVYNKPTHFTENSSSIIDLLFIGNKDSVLTSGVGEPCLDLSIRYHCPIFGVCKNQSNGKSGKTKTEIVIN